MLVIEEERVQEILKAINYLEQAKTNLNAFMERIDRDLAENRVSREKCIEVLTRNGCFRSYTLRACITGGQVFEP